jgi:hypothetical protein
LKGIYQGIHKARSTAMVMNRSSKLVMRVRFPSSALIVSCWSVIFFGVRLSLAIWIHGSGVPLVEEPLVRHQVVSSFQAKPAADPAYMHQPQTWRADEPQRRRRSVPGCRVRAGLQWQHPHGERALSPAAVASVLSCSSITAALLPTRLPATTAR